VWENTKYRVRNNNNPEKFISKKDETDDGNRK
jgi:hypothetical protein